MYVYHVQIIVLSPTDGYVTLVTEGQYQSHNENAVETNITKQEACLPDNTSSSQQHPLSADEALVEETIRSSETPATFRNDSPNTTAEIQPTRSTSLEEKYENLSSPAVSEGEYLPYANAVNQHYSSSENNHSMQKIFTTETRNAESIKQTNPIADRFQLIDDNLSHATPHAYPFADKNNTNINDIMEACVDKCSHVVTSAGQQMVQHNYKTTEADSCRDIASSKKMVM